MAAALEERGGRDDTVGDEMSYESTGRESESPRGEGPDLGEAREADRGNELDR